MILGFSGKLGKLNESGDNLPSLQASVILTRKRELVAFLLLSFGCLVTVNVLKLFLTVTWVDLQFVIVVFPDHPHFLMDEQDTKKSGTKLGNLWAKNARLLANQNGLLCTICPETVSQLHQRSVVLSSDDDLMLTTAFTTFNHGILRFLNITLTFSE